MASFKYQVKSGFEKEGLKFLLNLGESITKFLEIYELGESIPLIHKFRMLLEPYGLYPNTVKDLLKENMSVKTILHYGQIELFETLQQFDYGSDKNMQIYNQTTPPEILVENIKNVPINMIVGK